MLVGQSYDGAGNVRGKVMGLKTRINVKAPKVMYVWCCANRLNLVIEVVLKCCPVICNTLGIIQELFNFFLGHKRHSILREMQTESRYTKSLKRVSDTTRSWRSAEDGTSTILECYDSIVGALDNLATNSQDSNTSTSATGLLCKLQDARCIMTVILLQRIFRITGPVSRILQGTVTDLSIAAILIDGCIQSLAAKREKVDTFFHCQQNGRRLRHFFTGSKTGGG